MNKYRQTKTSFNFLKHFLRKIKNSNNIKGKFGATIAIILCLTIIITLTSYIVHLQNNPVIKEVEIEKEIIVTTVVETIVEVEKVVTTEVYIEPTPVYDVTDVEREMIARLLFREAGGESYEGQKMVVSVIFNRYIAAGGEKTIEEIIYQPGQFTPASLIYQTTPTEMNYQVVDEIIMHGSILPYYVKYFRDYYHFDWQGYVGYTDIDEMYFGYLSKDV